MLPKQSVVAVQAWKLATFLEEAGGPLLNLLDRSLCLGECRTRLITTVDIDVFPFPPFVYEISSSPVRQSGALISPIRALVDPSHGIPQKDGG